MAAPLTTTTRRVDRGRRTATSTTSAPQVSRDTDLADYPLAERRPRRACSSTPPTTMATADRRALQAELIRALADGPGVVVFEGAFDHDVVDRASAAFTALIEAQRADGRRRGRPLRQGRRQRPDLERRAEARAARPRGVRRLLRQRRAGAGVPGLARPALPGHLTGQRRQSRWRSAGSAPRLPPRLRRRRPVGGLSRRTCTGCRRR